VALSFGGAIGTGWKVKASGGGFTFATTDIAAGATASLTSSEALPETIDSRKLKITWQMSLDGGTNWFTIGETENQLYVIGAQQLAGGPALEAYETVLHLGSEGAKGKRPRNPGEEPVVASQKDQEVVDAIWEEFKERNMKRADGESLTYWKTTERLEDGGHPYRTATALLKFKDGDCYAWSDLLISTLSTQGIAGAGAIEITSKYKNSNFLLELAHLDRRGKPAALLIKNWNFGAGGGPDRDGFTHPDGTFTSGNRIAAQGNNESPSAFQNHRIVSYGGKFYDPSYGGEAYSTQKTWEIASLAGFRRWDTDVVDGVVVDVREAKKLDEDAASEVETIFHPV